MVVESIGSALNRGWPYRSQSATVSVERRQLNPRKATLASNDLPQAVTDVAYRQEYCRVQINWRMTSREHQMRTNKKASNYNTGIDDSWFVDTYIRLAATCVVNLGIMIVLSVRQHFWWINELRVLLPNQCRHFVELSGYYPGREGEQRRAIWGKYRVPSSNAE